MAQSAGSAGMPPGQGKRGQGVIERRLRPIGGVVALLAALPHATLMSVVLLVTGVAAYGRALEHVVHMARGASGAGMPSSEKERCFRMVDCRLFPVDGVVALLAALPHATLMSVVLLVTGVAACGRALEHVVHMAQGASGAGMPSGENERCLRVVYGRLFPVNSVVALLTALPEAAFVLIVFLVTGGAGCWGASQDTVCVT